jgi:CBS domain-containing protein
LEALAENLIAENLPAVRPTDTGQQVLNLMEACRVTQLPVVKEKEYLGLISDRLVYDFNLTGERIEQHTMPLHTPHVHAGQHLFEVAAVMYKLNLEVIAVVDSSHNYLGAILLRDLSARLARLFSVTEPGGVLILRTTWNNYSTSQISQIIEGNDTRILSLFVSRTEKSDLIEVTIKLDKVDLSAVIQTFTRYDYEIAAVYMDDSMLNDMYEDRLEQFLKYLNM